MIRRSLLTQMGRLSSRADYTSPPSALAKSRVDMVDRGLRQIGSRLSSNRALLLVHSRKLSVYVTQTLLSLLLFMHADMAIVGRVVAARGGSGVCHSGDWLCERGGTAHTQHCQPEECALGRDYRVRATRDYQAEDALWRGRPPNCSIRGMVQIVGDQS